MALIEKLLPDVRHYATAAPDIVSLRELRNALTEFFDRSFIWKERQTFSAASDGVSTFTLTLPPETRLNRVESVRTRKYEYRGDSEVGFDAKNNNFKYIVNADGDVEITPALKRDETIEIVFSVTTKRDATEIPDEIYEQYGEAIAHGAAGRLLAMPERQWSSPNSVSYHMSIFNAGMMEATRRAQAAGNRIVRVAKFSW